MSLFNKKESKYYMLNNDVVELYFVVVALDIVKIVFLCTSYEINNGCVSILFIFIINIGVIK